MLANLKIENVAVIEKAEVNFTPGFNVLTGETGAGKSILIDSINAILGNRTSRELVRSGAQKACIWATFENIPQSVKKQLEKCGYEANDDLLLYREINAEGKGSCRVNGMPATAAVVRDISAGLLSIHGQHDSQSLTNPALHLGLLDQYAQNRDLFADYYRRYRELVTVKRQLDALNASEADKQRKIEALTAEIDAIDAAALQPGEEKNLQERKTVITHAQGILDGITAAHGASYEIKWQQGYAVGNNHDATNHIAREAIARHFPAGTLQLQDKALFGSEDFSSYQEKIPGTFLFIGCGNPQKGATWNVHNPHFRIDEDALAVGIKTHIALVSELLNEE